MIEVKIDTRERKPFQFEDPLIKTTKGKIDTGDYTVVGLEDKLCIERKGSITEFYGNVTEDRFWKEMVRMKDYKYKFIIFEFSVAQVECFPYGCGLKKEIIDQMKVSSSFLMDCITRLQVKFGIHVLFGGDTDNSMYLTTNIMKAVYEQEK